jgi:asparagine synthase (glutamine-hydrolysing)
MCGIAGIASLTDEPSDPGETVRLACSMAGTLTHRGPDDGGVWASPNGTAVLAHRRLSIVDLSPLGRNPMLWDHGRLAITFNGEIYNFLELRSELERAGHRFRSRTDTEVILAAYDQWGVDCIQRFAGMFAFALWDERRRRLWVVRDRLGKKPLYYAECGSSLVFGSELKAFAAHPRFPRTLDGEALRLYLRFGYIPAPYTIFQEARKLEPAHYLVCEAGQVSLTRYWDPLTFAAPHPARTDVEAQAELEGLLRTAVRQRQIADVPLGAFLSGGIDSSVVVALMQEYSEAAVRTFTIRFADPEFNEADHAAAVARHLGTEHHEHLCDEAEMLSVVDKLPDIFDEPFGDSSAIPTYLVSQMARRHVTVALSGDGGDELFLGYPRYRYYADATRLLALPRAVRRLVAGAVSRAPLRRLRRIADVLRSDDPDAYARFITWFPPEDVKRISGGPATDATLYHDMLTRSGGVRRELRPGLLDLVSYLPDDILAKVDRVSMAVSLEVRAPLLDHRVVEFALGLPLHLKRRGGTMKWLLRSLLYKRVPRHLIERPKMGFGVPLTRWFHGALRARMDAYCESAALEDLGLDPAPIRGMWQEFKGGHYHRPDLLWQAFVLMAWSRRFLVTPPPAGSGSVAC